jgi:hypothetical protein
LRPISIPSWPNSSFPLKLYLHVHGFQISLERRLILGCAQLFVPIPLLWMQHSRAAQRHNVHYY